MMSDIAYASTRSWKLTRSRGRLLIWVIVALMLVIGLIILVIKWLSSVIGDGGRIVHFARWAVYRLVRTSRCKLLNYPVRVYIVGVGENITLLDKIDDPDKRLQYIDAIEQQNSRTWNTSVFDNLVNRFRNRILNVEPHENEPWQEAVPFTKCLQYKMKTSVGTETKG